MISSDPRTWHVLPNVRNSLKPRKRDTVQLWIKSCYIGISDDVYDYLGQPRYLQIRLQGESVALLPVGADEPNARKVHPPKHPRKFWHLSMNQSARYLRQGDYHNLRFRQVAGEPYVAFDAASS